MNNTALAVENLTEISAYPTHEGAPNFLNELVETYHSISGRSGRESDNIPFRQSLEPFSVCRDLIKDFSRNMASGFISSVFESIAKEITAEGFSGSANRILELRTMDDYEEGENPPTLDSTLGFKRFITKFSCLGEPVLGVFPEGTLSAGWRVADNRHLLIEFLDNDNVSFAIIKPDDNAPDGKFRLNGRGSQKTGLELLEKYGVTQWRE